MYLLILKHEDDFSYCSSTSQESDYDFEGSLEDSESEQDITGKFQQVDDEWMKIERRSPRQTSTWLKDFQSQVGSDNCYLTSESSPLQYFSLIFSEDTVESITKWTNVLVKSRIDNANRRKQKKAIWKDLF